MNKNTYLGKFITIDGIDGAGKSTQIKFITDWFSAQGFNVSEGHEPTSGEFGLKIQDILFKKKPMPDSPLDFQKLYIQDRKEHLISEIIPSLKKENSVYISDRYFLATLAYGEAAGADFDEILKAHEDIIGDDFILPDIMIILNTSPQKSMERLDSFKGTAKDVFEKKSGFQVKVSENFKKIKEKFENVYLVNGDLAVEEINLQIENILKENFK